ncbi:hypothetical protein GGR52DRAFT_569566 [Hypoxylon sp. FL1284]|nr:hypothetical protein GGR52DRAFT_569566 [Hypoxylon sp. FL1284]
MQSTKKGTKKEVSYEGKGICLEVGTANEGWAELGESLAFPKFAGRRANAPAPLENHSSGLAFHEENIRFQQIKVSLAQPGFDWGLGCFGHAHRLVETGRGEIAYIHLTDANELRMAEEFARDGRGFRDDDHWIRFQRLFREDAKLRTEQDLVNFHRAAQMVSQVDSHQAAFQQGGEEDEEERYVNSFFANLDELESARSGEEDEEQNGELPVASTRALPVGLRDWIDEAGFVEANADMPQGTRYYKSGANQDV